IIGIIHTRAHRPADAAPCFQRAAELYRDLSRANRGEAHYRGGLALALSALGSQLTLLGRLTEGAAAAGEAVQIGEDLMADFPDSATWRDFITGIVMMEYAWLLEVLDRRKEALEKYRRILAIQDALMHDYPSVARYRYRACVAQQSIGELLWDDGQP